MKELIAFLTNRFSQGGAVKNTRELVKLAELAGLQPSLHYKDFKELYDIAEFALNLHTYKHISEYHLSTYEWLLRQQQLLCVETERSVDQSTFQQFSTPLHLAYLMKHLLNIENGKSNVLEPSAGTGTLAFFMGLSSPNTMIINEFHHFRFNLLNRIDNKRWTIHKEDAQQIHNMPKFHDYKIDRVVMNPPFSRSATLGKKVDILSGAKHLVSAFKLLQPNGRLVAVMPATFDQSSKAYKYFRAQCKANPLLNAQIDDDAFERKGTTFKTRLLVLSNNHQESVISNQKKISIKEAYQQFNID